MSTAVLAPFPLPLRANPFECPFDSEVEVECPFVVEVVEVGAPKIGTPEETISFSLSVDVEARLEV